MDQLQQLHSPLLGNEDKDFDLEEAISVSSFDDDENENGNGIENGDAQFDGITSPKSGSFSTERVEESGREWSNQHQQEEEALSNGLERVPLPAPLGEDEASVVIGNGSLGGGGSENRGLFSFLGDRPDLGPVPTIDPFQNDTPDIVSLYEWIKIIICIPLAIIRFISSILLGCFLLLLTKIALFGWTRRDLPMPKWRRYFMLSGRFCVRCVLFFFGYHWIHRTGKLAKREEAPIVVSNHVSYSDPLFFFYELFPIFVSSQSHDSLPLVGTLIRAMQVIFVDRVSPDSRKLARKEIKRKALCDDYSRVMLFPEGTTTNGRCLIFFQTGAFAPGLPVQPVIMKYPHVHFDISWGRISALTLVLRMLTQFHNFMEVQYLPVVYPSVKEKSNPLLYARKVRNVMAKALNVAETDHSYGDLVLSVKSSELKLGTSSSYMVEMAKMERLFHLSTSEAKGYLEKFAVMDTCQSGEVMRHQYLRALNLPETSLSEAIFAFFDKEEHGFITFREFVAGSAFISKHQSFGKLLLDAFEECDIPKRGYLSKEKVEQVLLLAFEQISKSQVDQIFKRLDADGDGSVSFNDFKAFIMAHPELLAIFLQSYHHEVQ